MSNIVNVHIMIPQIVYEMYIDEYEELQISENATKPSQNIYKSNNIKLSY